MGLTGSRKGSIRVKGVETIDMATHRIARLGLGSVSYTHLRAHETVLDLVCRLLLENKNNTEF